jgi:hypothetical protein
MLVGMLVVGEIEGLLAGGVRMAVAVELDLEEVL